MPFGARNSCESSAEASARVDPSLSSIPKVPVFGHSVHIVNNESTSTWSIRKIKSEYRIRNYPDYEKEFKDLFKGPFAQVKENLIKSELGESNYRALERIKVFTDLKGIQTRLPFLLEIN